MIAFKAEATAAAALEGERAIAAIHEEVDAAGTAGSVNDLGKAEAGVGGAIGPEMTIG